MDGFEGLTMPGRCQNCGKNGPRFSFRNTYAEPEIHMDLCLRCMDTALHAVHIFRQTPAGWEARKKKLLRDIG